MKNHSGGQGGFSIDELCNKLPDAGLLQINLRNEVRLTRRGHSFAQWLIDNGHKADYFRSDVGNWGELPARGGFRWPHQHAHDWPDANVEPKKSENPTQCNAPNGKQ